MTYFLAKNSTNLRLKNVCFAFFASAFILQSCSSNGNNENDQYQDQGQDYKFAQTSTSDPSFNLKQDNSVMPAMQNSQMNPVLNQLSEEYKKIADMFLAKNGEKQSDYFRSKSSDVIQNQFIEYEIVPNDMIERTKNPRLSNLIEKEKIVKDIVSQGRDESLNAKLISNYDCAVVDVIESVMSGTSELTTCYDDLNTIVLAMAPAAEVVKTPTEPQAVAQTSEGQDKLITIAKLKPYTEQVNKVFSVIEFDKDSQSVDISYYDHFKSIGDITSKYKGDYKITIVGYHLYDETPYKTVKLKKGRIKTTKRSVAAIKAAQKVNNMLKARALTVRKMLVTNGIDDSKIVIAHPESEKVKFLYNIKDGPQGQNLLENLVIIDMKFDEKNDDKNSITEAKQV